MSANTDPALLAIQQALADTQAALVQLQTQATNIENGLAGVLAQLNSGDDNAVSAAAATLETVATQIGGIATALGTAAAAIPTPPAAAAPTS